MTDIIMGRKRQKSIRGEKEIRERRASGQDKLDREYV